MSLDLQRFRHDIFGVFWLGFSIFLILALYSFNPSDPSFNSTGTNLVVQNLCGYFGSFLSDLLYQAFGVISWVFVLITLKLSFTSFRGSGFSLKGTRILWAVSLLLVSASLLTLHLPQTSYFAGQIAIGGFIGLVIAKSLVAAFNWMGVAVILWSSLTILLVFFTEKPLSSWLYLPKQTWNYLADFWEDNLSERFSGFKASALENVFGLKTLAMWLSVSFTKIIMLVATIKGFFSRKTIALSDVAGEAKIELTESLSNESEDEEDEDDIFEEGDIVGDSVEVGGRKFFALPSLKGSTSSEKEEFVSGSKKKRRVKLDSKIQRHIENWTLPKLDLMEDPPENRVRINEADIEMKADILTDKLSQFSVGGEIVGVKTGPAVTMYEFKPNSDVKISKITDLDDDLSLALSSESVRIIAPIPGRNVVGIETSNDQRETVYLKDIVAEGSFWGNEINLPIPLGRKADGTPRIVDLCKMPHLLVAGTTGSGKSVFVVSILTGLIFKHSPKTLKLILIDPKQVDLAAFGSLPHLAMPLIRDSKKAIGALRWAINEMEKRYRSMAQFGARGIAAFNEIVSKLTKEQKEEHENANQALLDEGQPNEVYYFEPQSFVVIVVEEFGDLMAVDKANVEQAVVRLAQMARASGIHLILAMQSPRKDVVTGLIKTNIPGRISFKVASKMDSRIILDDSGAERLLARGDMLFLAPGESKPSRHHGPWLTEDEIDATVKFWSDQGEPEFDDLAMRALDGSGGGFDMLGGPAGGSGGGSGEDSFDERYDEILAWVSTQKSVSASLLQRKFRLGYPRAARMIENFEEEGVVGPVQGSKPRKVLISDFPEA